MFNFIVIGAGLAGCTIAERIANILGEKVLLIEKRNHIGGNCYDYYNEYGILVHKYGPHIFHTNYREVWDYISKFTEWIYYQHKVLAYVDGKKVPIPFNLNTLELLFSKHLSFKLERKLIEKFGYGSRISILKLKEVEDKDLKLLADFIYEKFFLNYTIKQWNTKPEELEENVTARVPINISRDDRYFQDIYQGIPKEGYTKIFEKMLNTDKIKILLNTDYKEIIEIDFIEREIYLLGRKFKGKLIFTGMIDEFFNYELGELPYRSLKFQFKTYNKEYYQEVATINYPNDFEFTRITEFKHMTGQFSLYTTVAEEYPKPYEKEKNIPYYPIPKKENIDLYNKYLKRAKEFKNVLFVGRLAEYKYSNMDYVVKRSLESFQKLKYE